MIQLSRRIFLAAGASAGLVLALAPRHAMAAAPKDNWSGAMNDWVAVRPDGRITVRVCSAEMGQGAQTGLAQIIAEEMDADFATLSVEMAPVTKRYMVHGEDGYYTGGSSSFRDGQFETFSKAGATARAMLIAAAAKRWGVSAASLRTKNGNVYHTGSGRSLGYGALAADAAKLDVPQNVPLKPRDQRTLIGKPVKRPDIPAKTNGTARYGIDFTMDGLLTGTIAQCPVFGGMLAGVDAGPAYKIKGVTHVVKLDNAVAVVATNFWAAKKGLDALTPQWTKPANPIADDATMRANMKREIGAKDSRAFVRAGEDAKIVSARMERIFAAAPKAVEAEYEAPFLAHAPLEPMNATAHVTADTCELWAPMQAQDSMLSDVMKALNLPADRIILHTTLLGGGFGRRLKTDYGVWAARISQKIGKPVKLIWTREEDFTHDFYRPASIGRLKAALDKDLNIIALDMSGATMNDVTVGGLGDNYQAPIIVRQKKIECDVPIGAWRSVDASIHGFFIESLIDEIAHSAHRDPLDYRRQLLANKPRELRVLNKVAEMANWGHAPKGRFHGLAYFAAKHWKARVAQIVELSADANNKITLHKVYCTIDVGTAINPDQVAGQAMGGIMLGLSAALGEAITIRNGAVEQTNFDTYQILRMNGAPDVAVSVLDSPDAEIGGAGEPPVPPIAAALANAIFAATKKRLRRLPLTTGGITV